MKTKLTLAALIILTLSFFPISIQPALALPTPEDKQLYLRAQKSIKLGQKDFAFMRYGELLRRFPNSRYKDAALFGVAEYYFSAENYQEAESHFDEYIRQNSDFKKKLFAYGYLLKIAQDNSDLAMQNKIIEEILSLRQMGFVFDTSKEFHFYSAFKDHLKAIFTIDKIIFYRNDQPFVEVSYE